MSQSAVTDQPHQTDRSFLGHPRGLATLFFTELWERFSFYGLKALLLLFMTAPVATGGLGFDENKSGIVLAIYASMVYLTGLPGGWIADRFLGARRAVLIGGLIIMCGHISLAIHSLTTFYFGLFLIILGTGLLKPNVSTMVGQLYSERDARRDAGFSIFYMGINLGAFIAPFVCGYLAEYESFRRFLASQGIDPNRSWQFGFGAAAIGMFFGLIQYVLGGKYLSPESARPSVTSDPQSRRRDWSLLIGAASAVFIIVAILGALHLIGFFEITEDRLNILVGVFYLALTIGYFSWLFIVPSWQPVERKRLIVIAVLFLFSVLFWMGYEQAASTLTEFAKNRTDRSYGEAIAPHAIASVGTDKARDQATESATAREIPASWFQSINPAYVILFAPVFAWLWIRLGKYDLSSPSKFAIGLFIMGLGYFIMTVAAFRSGPEGYRVSPLWLVACYFCHSVGELCLSPVGLSSVTKLAPQRVANQMMGVWFLSLSLGEFLAHQCVRFIEAVPLTHLFGTLFVLISIASLVLAALVVPIRRLMGGVV